MTTITPSKTSAMLHARYGDAAPQPGPTSPAIETMLAHRSVRAFLPQPLPAGTLQMLVAAAQSAATSSNLQVWSVVAVEEPAHKARVATLAGDQEFIRQAPLFLAWCADLARVRRVAAARGAGLEGADYLEAWIVASVDATLAAQNAAVAAESLGLGICYVGALRNHPEAVAAELGLPPHVMAVFGLAVGHPDPAKPAAVKPRLPQSTVLHRERYDTAAEAEALPDYDRLAEAFSVAQGMGAADWSDRAVARLADAKSLHGRDRMKAALAALGFPLR